MEKASMYQVVYRDYARNPYVVRVSQGGFETEAKAQAWAEKMQHAANEAGTRKTYSVQSVELE